MMPSTEGASSLLKIKKLSENAITPSRGSTLSAGYDLSSAVETKVPARGKALIPTDLSISIPDGTYARIALRSELAWKHSVNVVAGVIEADYRGPVGVVLFNFSDVDFEIKIGDRIAQLIIERIMPTDVVEVDALDATVRGEGGFGSTDWLLQESNMAPGHSCKSSRTRSSERTLNQLIENIEDSIKRRTGKSGKKTGKGVECLQRGGNRGGQKSGDGKHS